MQRKQPLKRTGRPKPRSAKRAKMYREERVPLVQRLLAEHPYCQRCRKNASADVHELKSRARGGSILDESNLVCLCRPCHNWVTTHPKEAEEQGWSLPSWA